LLERGDKPAADLAHELGNKRNQLYKWQKPLKAKGQVGVFPGHGRRISPCSASSRGDKVALDADSFHGFAKAFLAVRS
jgi:hypothetical protein